MHTTSATAAKAEADNIFLNELKKMKFYFDRSCPRPFVKEATTYLMHKRGRNSKGFHIQPGSKHEAGVWIYLGSPEEMEQRYGMHKHLKGLSVTDSRSSPIIIDIHSGNWTNPPSKFKGSQQEYRAYLINHEMGHALGFGHTKLGKGKCQLMAQQTKGTQGCIPNGYPN